MIRIVRTDLWSSLVARRGYRGRLIATALVVGCGLLAFGELGRSAEVYLGITRSTGAKIPIAILGVQAASEMASSAVSLRSIIESDLRRSRLFEVMAVEASPATGGPPDAARIKQAASSGLDAVLWGRSTRERDEGISWEGFGYDGGNGALVLQKRYVGRDESVRAIAHKFSNAVVTAYTGEKGIAESQILFVSDRSGRREVYRMDYDGAGVTKLTSDRSIAMTPRWSSDKRLFTYVSYRGGQPTVYSYALASGRRWQATRLSGMTMSPAWSPSGDRLALASNAGENFDLYLADAEGTTLQRLTFGGGDDLSPAWSPTGLQLAYTSDRGGSPQVYTMNADGSDQRRLTFEGPYNTTPVYSPKGDWIAYTCRVGGVLQLCLISPDGSQQVQLTNNQWDNEAPSWSPDGRQLVFSSMRGETSHLYVIGTDGTGEERLTSEPGNDRMPSWSPN